MSDAAPVFFDAAQVRRRLSIEACIPLIGPAMLALSSGEARWLLRSFISLGDSRTFAQMPGALSMRGYFGAKLVSVFADPSNPGHRAHEGVVVLFEGERGKLIAMGDAAEITRVRTAAASAVATKVLARTDAQTMAILGGGVQALAHIEAIAQVRPLSSIRVWARRGDAARKLADAARRFTAAPVEAAESVEAACANADIVCAVTGASDPILELRHIRPGAHVNAVGSSAPHAAEIGPDLVAASRFIADHRAHVLVHGGEFLRAKAMGLVSDSDVAAEIGEVLSGVKAGRRSDAEITIYKSLGHVVQDLAALAWLYEEQRPA